MRIPEETVEKIRQESNILDIVSQYVQLKKKGQNHFAFCPFHEERTPSFSVREEKQLYHCFSCGRGGNVFSFLMEMEGLSFPESVIKTAELANISLDPSLLNAAAHARPKEDSEKGRLIRIHEQAKEFYHHILMHTKIGEEALAYLLNRGLKKETIESFEIGFAPEQRTLLKQFFLEKKEFEDSTLRDSGLFTEREDGDWNDRFFGRIMFPLKDHQGNTVAFSGRILNSEENSYAPKYLNSPETELFNKRKLLFHFDGARPSIRKEKEVYLFEGFMDVISSFQAGIPNALATMGTSLTTEHVQQLGKITDHVILSFDGDDAGKEAIKRAGDFLEKETAFSIEVVQFPEKMDPDDFIRKRGEEAYKEFTAHSRLTFFGFLMDYHRKDRNLHNDSQRIDYIDTVLHEMTKVPSAIEREVYFQQLTEEFHLPIETLKDQFQSIYLAFRKRQTSERKERRQEQQTSQAPVQITVRKQTTVSSVERAERQLLNRLFHFEEARSHLKVHYPDFHFFTEDHHLVHVLFDQYQQETAGEVQGFIEYLNESSLKEKVVEIEWQTYGEEYTNQELDDCVRVIQKQQWITELEDKKQAIKRASKSGDSDLQQQLLMEIVSLNRLLKSP